MLIVTNGTQTEPILESNYEKFEEQNGAALQLSFSSFSFDGNVGHNLLDFEVLIEDTDGHEYKVKQYIQDATEKQITATHIFYELNNFYKHDIYGGTHTFDEFATWLFEGTGWTFTNADITTSVLLPNFGENNVIALLQTLISKFSCEFKILPNKVIQFATVIGEDNDIQYRYKHNITSAKQTIDTSNLKTRIRGYGANNLTVTYTSPLADNPKIGIRDAEPIHDESFTTEAELLEHIKSQLPSAPDTVVEVGVIDVDGNVGDYVWVIHEKMNLSYQTRILSKKTKRNYLDSTVVLGNMKPKDITDVLVNQKVEIDENKKEYRSKFTQTNELIEMEVEAVNESISKLSIRADGIEMNVANVDGKVANLSIRADQIQASVTAQDAKIGTMESTITQHANEISMKVSQTDYNGNTIASMINQTATTVSINAAKINLSGAVMVNGSISGSTDISVDRNAKIGDALYFGGSGMDYIDVSSGNISYNSWGKHVFNGAIGVDVYGNLTVSGGITSGGKRVLTTDDLPVIKPTTKTK